MSKKTNLNRLRAALNESDCESLILRSPSNIEWLSDFTGSTGWLFLDSQENYLATDSRYETQAIDECKHWNIVIGERHGASNIANIINNSSVQQIAILEKEVSLQEYNSLIKLLDPKKELTIINQENDFIANLRMNKSKKEIESIEQSAQLASQVIEFGMSKAQSGMTELGLVALIENYAKQHRAQQTNTNYILSVAILALASFGSDYCA